MKIFLTISLLFFLSIDNYANAQVRLNACGVDGRPAGGFFTKNCNDTNSSKSSTSEPISSLPDNIICNSAVEGKPEYLLEAKRRGLSCGVSSTASQLQQYSDWRVCDEVEQGKPEWNKEAKRRGLSCGVSSTASQLQQYSDWRVCDEVVQGKPEWIKEDSQTPSIRLTRFSNM
jgi:hypothetical protein